MIMSAKLMSVVIWCGEWASKRTEAACAGMAAVRLMAIIVCRNPDHSERFVRATWPKEG